MTHHVASFPVPSHVRARMGATSKMRHYPSCDMDGLIFCQPTCVERPCQRRADPSHEERRD
jgi:hypothetical protein